MTRRLFFALACGVLFGAGLVVSDMINPARVLAFLDVAGDWDPALAFVMGGALVVSLTANAIRHRLERPLLDERFHLPTNRRIDARLVGGAVIFGVGWGLVGLCPGPALAGLLSGRWQLPVFVGAMIAGMGLYYALKARLGVGGQ